MEEQVYVYVDLNNDPELAGRLWSRARKGQESATFEYDRTWLESPNRFSLEPALMLGPGPFHTAGGKALFGAIGDSAPDRWGRVLMRRAERRVAGREKRTPRTLREIDYLLMVDDEARQGALRFAKTPGGPFLRPEGPARIPPVLELPRLLAAAERFDAEEETDQDIRLLLAPGSSAAPARKPRCVKRTGSWGLQNSRINRMRRIRSCGRLWRCGLLPRRASPCLPGNWRKYRGSRCFCCSALTVPGEREFRFCRR